MRPWTYTGDRRFSPSLVSRLVSTPVLLRRPLSAGVVGSLVTSTVERRAIALPPWSGRLQHRRASRCTGSHLGWTGDRPRLGRCYGHRHGGAASLTRSVTRFVNLWYLYRTEWRAGISMSFAGDAITVTIAAGVGFGQGAWESNGTTDCIRFHDISSVDHPATHPARFRS